MSATPPTGYERLPPELAGQVDAACDRFERAWREGGRPAVEDHLTGVHESARPVLVRELVLVEALYRRQAGETPRPDELRSRFPELDDGWLAGALAEYFRRGGAESPTQHAGPPPGVTHAPAVPGYEVVGEIGRGGMGVVYKARDVRLGRWVALKFLTGPAAREPRPLERFRREARAAGALNHPAVCTLYDLGEHDGRPFLVLEWIDGQTLRELADRPPDPARLVPLIRQAAGALRAAHAAGIVHRDIKPENLMVRPDGYVKVLDFGVARLLPGPNGHHPLPPDADTEPGTLIGTVHYMSPEQARGEPVGSATDIFALGIVLYELATGRHPFAADTRHGTLHAIMTEPAVAPSRLNPEIPAPLEALTLQMLEKEPGLRPTAAGVEGVLGDLAVRDARPAATVAAAGPRVLVGRDAERAALEAALGEAESGRGVLVCVAGEPGIGKTALVEEFLRDVTARGRVARGRCSERLSGADVYLPVLEALDSLLRGETGDAVARAMRLVAPGWYAQVVPSPAGGGAAASEEYSSERLKRELLGLMQEVTRQRPLVLFLDDIHWADESSIDLLAYLAARCEGLRLLLLVTYRPTELLIGPHPFVPVQLELQRHALCREVALGFLGLADVESYLARAFPGHRFPPELAVLVRARTEGNPLFLVDLLRYLRDRGVIVADDGGWVLAQAVPAFGSELPESVRSMIRRKLDLLGPADLHLLSAAGLQGPEFDSAVAARVLGLDPADVEERLADLDRVHGLVRLRREHEFPDGTLSLRYQFVHVLYQNVLDAAIQPARRAAWSAAAARALLEFHRGHGDGVAGELALLFEAARDAPRAVEYFLRAARHAVRVGAVLDAAGLARRGLALLPKLPDTPDRARAELGLLLTLGVSLVSTKGFAAPKVEQAYLRARELCQQADDLGTLFPVLYGLWNVYLVRCDLPRCRELAEQMAALARGQSDPVFLLVAHNVQQQPLFHQSDFAAARRHQEEGWASYDPPRHRGLSAVYGEDPGVGCLVYGAPTLWHLGYPDQARQMAHAARELAEDLAHPFNVAQALYYGAYTFHCRREPERVREWAEALIELSREHGFPLLLAGGTILRGWSLAQHGDVAEGIAAMRQGLADWQATGALSHRPCHLALLAEALGRAGNIGEGLEALAEAEALCASLGECFYEPEIHRLRGELLLGRPDRGDDTTEAEAAFRNAVAAAQRQGARVLELRALASWASLPGEPGRSGDVRRPLAAAYERLTEGWETPDLRRAKAVLARSP